MQFSYDNYLELLNSILAQHSSEKGITSEQVSEFREHVIKRTLANYPVCKVDILPYHNQNTNAFEFKIYLHFSRTESYGYDLIVPNADNA
jgi:hypothetical protein